MEIQLIPETFKEFSLEKLDHFLEEVCTKLDRNPCYLCLSNLAYDWLLSALQVSFDGVLISQGAAWQVVNIASYTNKTTGRVMHVLKLPTLPDRMIAVGDIVFEKV